MTEITLQLPDPLAARLASVQEQLPRLLELVTDEGLPLSAQVYLEALEFLASNPTSQQILEFRPIASLQTSIGLLQDRNNDGTLTLFEKAELERLLRVEHLMRAIKLRAREQASRN